MAINSFPIETTTVDINSVVSSLATTTKIAVIGDSLSVIAPARSNPWPLCLEDYLNGVGADVKFDNFAVGGTSFDSAFDNFLRDENNIAVDQVDKVSAGEYDAVIVALGYNDVFTEGKDITTIQTHIDTFVSALKTATDAPIFFIREFVWDRNALAPATGAETAFPNRLVIPQLHETLYTSDTGAGTGNNRVSNVPEYFDKDIGSTKRGRLYTLQQLNDYLKSLASSDSQLNDLGVMDLFSVCRLGCHTDGLHVDEIGHRLIAASFLSPLIDALPDFLRVADNSKHDTNELYSLEDVFSAVLNGADYSTGVNAEVDPSRVVGGFGRDYAASANNTQTLLAYHNYPWRQRLDTWYISHFRDLQVSLPTAVYDANTPMVFHLCNIPPVGTINIWNDFSSAWSSGFTRSYDGRIAGMNNLGSLTITATMNQLSGGSNPEATDAYGSPSDPAVPPIRIGVRLQNGNFSEGFDFIEIFTEVQILNVVNDYVETFMEALA